MTAREAAYTALCRCERGGYANLALDGMLKKSELQPADRALCTELCYGVIERMLTLDYALESRMKHSVASQSAPVRTVLRMGAYQIMYLDRVPDSAAVDESVKLIKKYGKKGEASFVNAVLRAVARDVGKVNPPEGDAVRRLSVVRSVSPDIAGIMLRAYGDKAEDILSGMSRGGGLHIRVNELKTDADALLRALCEGGVDARRAPGPAGMLELRRAGGVSTLPGFGEGWFFVQNPASAFCVDVLAARPGETIVDVCAAPGGKSFGAAISMGGRGRVLAFDLHESRVRLIREGAERLGITCIEAAQRDARAGFADLAGAADAVLCDVPCSGLGVMAQKPDIRYKRASDLEPLPALQMEILRRAAVCVRPGGRLIYSTCTLDPRENEDVVRGFLAENADFAPENVADAVPSGFLTHGDGPWVTILPRDGVDGFFAARLRRIKGETR